MDIQKYIQTMSMIIGVREPVKLSNLLILLVKWKSTISKVVLLVEFYFEVMGQEIVIIMVMGFSMAITMG